MRVMESRNIILLLSAASALVSCSTPDQPKPFTRGEIAERAAVFGLVDIQEVLPEVQIDLRYKDDRNVLKKPLYPRDMPCLLKRETAEKLKLALQFVGKYGYGLKIWDGWRPPEVQAQFYDALGHTGLFLDPKIMWSRHCTGTAVDITLITKNGRDVDMPTDHDMEGAKARYDAQGASEEEKRRVAILQNGMTEAGFLLIDTEWWHFDDQEFAFNQPRVVSARDLGLTLPP